MTTAEQTEQDLRIQEILVYEDAIEQLLAVIERERDDD